MAYVKYMDGGPPVMWDFQSAGAINPGDPVKLGGGGTITACADDDEYLLGWARSAATASGAEWVRVEIASDRNVWVLPVCGTVGGGDTTTAAGQATAGATLGLPGVRAIGSTLQGLIGAGYALDLTSGAYRVDLSDTTPSVTLPLQLIGYEYNEASGLYEGCCIVRSASRDVGSTRIV